MTSQRGGTDDPMAQPCSWIAEISILKSRASFLQVSELQLVKTTMKKKSMDVAAASVLSELGGMLVSKELNKCTDSFFSAWGMVLLHS